jgi:hypothetical protein
MIIDSPDQLPQNHAAQIFVKKASQLLFGVVYVYGHAALFAAATRASMAKCLVVAILATATLGAIVLCLARQMARETAGTGRFRIRPTWGCATGRVAPGGLPPGYALPPLRGLMKRATCLLSR